MGTVPLNKLIYYNAVRKQKAAPLTLSVSFHMAFVSKITTMGTQDSVNAMIMYPKRWASLPSMRFFPRSLAPGVRKHTAPTMAERLLGVSLEDEPPDAASAAATKSTARRGGSGLPVIPEGRDLNGSGGAACEATGGSLNMLQMAADTTGRGRTPRLTTFLRCRLTTLNIRT